MFTAKSDPTEQSCHYGNRVEINVLPVRPPLPNVNVKRNQMIRGPWASWHRRDKQFSKLDAFG